MLFLRISQEKVSTILSTFFSNILLFYLHFLILWILLLFALYWQILNLITFLFCIFGQFLLRSKLSSESVLLLFSQSSSSIFLLFNFIFPTPEFFSTFSDFHSNVISRVKCLFRKRGDPIGFHHRVFVLWTSVRIILTSAQ